MDRYVEVDVFLELSSVCVLDAAGQIDREAKIANELKVLTTFLIRLGLPPTRIGLQTSPLSQWLSADLATSLSAGDTFMGSGTNSERALWLDPITVQPTAFSEK